MVSLGENLRAVEDIGVRRALEQLFEPVPRAHRVAIHAQDARPRKFFSEHKLDPLRPASKCLQIRVTAFWTGARNAFGQSAMVATQPLHGQMHDHVGRTAPAEAGGKSPPGGDAREYR